MKVLETKESWFGVTYKEDNTAVMESFKRLIIDGVYREEVYSNQKRSICSYADKQAELND